MKFLMRTKFFSQEAAAGLNSSGGAGGAGSGSAGTGGAAGAGTGGAGTGAAGAAGGSAGGAGADWLNGLSEDSRGYVGNKGWKGVSDAIDSYRGIEKLMGAPKERLMTLPERFYDDAGKLTAEGRAVRERIGAPKEAKDYALKVPEKGGDPKLMEHFRGVFHELGIPAADATKIADQWNAYIEGGTKAATEAAQGRARDQVEALKKEWGAAHEQNLNIAKQAIGTMGVTKDQVTALEASLGLDGAAKLFLSLGKKTGEGQFLSGQKPDPVLVPAAAKNEINELKMDKAFGKLLMAGDRDAKAKWDRLHQMAFVGEHRL